MFRNTGSAFSLLVKMADQKAEKSQYNKTARQKALAILLCKVNGNFLVVKSI
jgi:hypothetical protein